MDSAYRDRKHASTVQLDRGILERAFEQFPAGVIVAEAPSGRLLFVNAWVERIWGRAFQPQDTLDAYWLDQGFHVDGRPMHPDERPLIRAIRTGEGVTAQEILIRRPDGTFAVIEVCAAPIRDRDGRIIAGAAAYLDVTRQRRAEVRCDRLALQGRLLLEISAELCTHRSVRPACQAIARRCTGVLGDWCAVALIEPGCPCLRMAAIHHRDPRQVARLKRALAGSLPRRQDPLVAWALEQRRPVAVALDAPNVRALIRGTPAAQEAFTRFGIGAALLAPAYAGEEPLGLLCIGADARRDWDIEDLRLASVVADRAGAVIQGARLSEAERAAREVAERMARRFVHLHAITAALSEAATSAQVARVIVDRGALATNAHVAGVALLASDGPVLDLVHTRGAPEDLVAQWRGQAITARTPLADAAATGRPIFLETRAALRSQYPHLVDVYARLGIEASAALPLSVERRTAGLLCFAFAEPRNFDADERSLLLTLARQCGLALERVRLYEREHRIAEVLQQVFLPADVPQVQGVEIDAVYVPGAEEAAIGGDWYDVFDLPDGRVALSIGDVVGRGLQAAAIMGEVRQAIRVLAAEGHGPAAVLERAGRQLALIHHVRKMATATFGILDPVSLTLTYASAGHPGPLLATPDGQIESLPSGGVPLGVDHAPTVPFWTVALPRGALLVLYTDGLIEATRDVAEGQAALAAAVRAVLSNASGNDGDDRPASQARAAGVAPATPARAIRDRVLGGRRAADDLVILTVAVAPAPLERLVMSVPADPSSLPAVRRSFRRLARDLGLPEDRAFALQVALGEALNNAVEHAYGAGTGTIEVRGWRDGQVLTVEVEDHGRWRPERVEGRGYGLLIMRSLADAVDLVRELSRTVVRLSVAIPEIPSEPAGSAATGSPRPEVGGGTAQEAVDAAPRGALADDGQFRIRQVDGIPVIDVDCDVDITSAARLEATLEQAARIDRRVVVLALTGASYFDSQGTHVLFRFGRRLATHRQRLLIVAPAGRSVRSVLAMTGVADTFPVLDSIEDALRMAKRDA